MVAPVAWLVVAALVVLAAHEFVSATDTRPSYDAFGWLAWGRQVLLHWNLNTDGAPSWKPLTFFFTLPYAAFGERQLSLWTLTSSTAAIASSVFAARIAYRLTGVSSEPVARRWPALIAGAFAGAGVLGLTGLPHQMLIATSDPMVVTLCLAAIDAHLSGRPRIAFAMIVLAALGRPEAWAFAGLYGLWCLVTVRRTRILFVLGLLLIPAGWFVIPGITSHSWFISGDLALNFPGAIHGNKIIGVTDRFLALYELPMQVAAVCAVAIAVLRRDRTWLALALCAVLWIAVEIAFAFHGWPASQRYLMEAAAVFVVLAGAAVGRTLDFAARGSAAALLPAALLRSPPMTSVLRVGAAGAVVVLGFALAPVVQARERLWRVAIRHAKIVAVPVDQLEKVVQLLGPAEIKACGAPVTFVGFQSALAWNVGLNVGDVGYKPRREFHSGKPIVFFRPIGDGWLVRPVHTRSADAAACSRVAIAYDLPASASPVGIEPLPGVPARLGHAGALPGVLARLGHAGALPLTLRLVRPHIAKAPQRHRRRHHRAHNRVVRRTRRPARRARRKRASVSGGRRRAGRAADHPAGAHRSHSRARQ